MSEEFVEEVLEEEYYEEEVIEDDDDDLPAPPVPDLLSMPSADTDDDDDAEEYAKEEEPELAPEPAVAAAAHSKPTRHKAMKDGEHLDHGGNGVDVIPPPSEDPNNIYGGPANDLSDVITPVPGGPEEDELKIIVEAEKQKRLEEYEKRRQERLAAEAAAAEARRAEFEEKLEENKGLLIAKKITEERMEWDKSEREREVRLKEKFEEEKKIKAQREKRDSMRADYLNERLANAMDSSKREQAELDAHAAAIEAEKQRIHDEKKAKKEEEKRKREEMEKRKMVRLYEATKADVS